MVASCLAHCSEYLIAQLACNAAGAACFPLETHFGPQMLQARLDSRDAGRGEAGRGGRGGAVCCTLGTPIGITIGLLRARVRCDVTLRPEA